jgi:5-methylcytosine-specific restriction protein B
MSRIFFGKFDVNRPIQIQEKYYASGAKGGPWYGGIEPGDYVFVVSASKVIGLWRVREYGNKQNPIHVADTGVVFFDEVKSFPQPIPVSQFIKSPYFHVDINLLNKISKATINCGFFPIHTTASFPMEKWDQLSFAQERRFYVTLNTLSPPLAENDVLVAVNNLEESSIIGIFEWKSGQSQVYTEFFKLYEDKNPVNERYTLRELLEYAEEEAPNKKNYLKSVLSELEKQGYFVVNNPSQLYDNILVGRRKTPITKSNNSNTPSIDKVKQCSELELPEHYEQYRTYADLLDFNPNLILYGPPGTGKTFATKNIIEAFEYNLRKEYIPYNQVEKEDRVRFITFHQSYSYEEFIEGIRPQLDNDADEEGSGSDIRYKVESGILKQMVESASAQMIRAETQVTGISGAELIRTNSKVWKTSLGRRNNDDIYKCCKKENHVAVDFLDGHDLTEKTHQEIFSLLKNERDDDAQNPTMDANTLDVLVNQMNKGDIVFIYDGPWTIRDIGVITSDYKYIKKSSNPHVRSVTWLKEYSVPMDISEINGGIRLTMKTIYPLPRIQMSDVQKLIGGSNNPTDKIKSHQIQQKPYYLIIDEINRGNISKIFGELMTLIEKDKRQTLSTILPYSKKSFTLPKNFYLIGTMNTSDRSIAMLDTALRRRFVFVELEPDYDVMDQNTAKVGAVELSSLLLSVNKKISEKLDRDHRIGHAYLMDVLTTDDLYKSWYYKILPLIAEYFYNDISLIQSVVGSKFFDKSGSVIFLNITLASGEITSNFEKALVALYKGSDV